MPGVTVAPGARKGKGADPSSEITVKHDFGEIVIFRGTAYWRTRWTARWEPVHETLRLQVRTDAGQRLAFKASALQHSSSRN